MSVEIDVHQPARRPKTKKKTNKKKKLVGGDLKIPEKLFATLGKIYRFKRRGSATIITQTALSEVVGSFQFTLNSISGYTDMTALFDSYRIPFVQVVFTPQYNMAAVNNQSNLITPNLYTAIDLDDNSSPGSISALQEYATCKMTRFDRTQTRSFKPYAAKALYSGTFVSFGMEDGWIDCASPSVQWYGIKYGIEGGATGQTNLQSWKVNFIYFVEMKYSR